MMHAKFSPKKLPDPASVPASSHRTDLTSEPDRSLDEIFRSRNTHLNYGKLLSAEEERQLIRDWQEKKCARSRDSIILSYRPLAMKLIRKRGIPQESHDDFLQDACFGIIKALDRFELEKGFRFATYAIWWIRAEIQTSLYEKGLHSSGMTGSPKRISLRSQSAKRKASINLKKAGIEETDNTLLAEMSRILGIPERVLHEHEMSLKAVSLQTPSRLHDDSSGEMIDTLACGNSEDQDAFIIRKQFEDICASEINAMLSILTDRERDVILSRVYRDGKAVSLRKIGEKYGLCAERVRQIESSALQKMRSFANSKKIIRNFSFEYFS